MQQQAHVVAMGMAHNGALGARIDASTFSWTCPDLASCLLKRCSLVSKGSRWKCNVLLDSRKDAVLGTTHFVRESNAGLEQTTDRRAFPLLKLIGLSARVMTVLSSHLGFCRQQKEESRSQGQVTLQEASYILLNERPSAVEAAIVLVLGAGTNNCLETISETLKAVRSNGGLGVCIATKPFMFEGQRRLEKAERTLATLMAASDLLVVVEHEAFLRRDGITVVEASNISNNTVLLGIQAISELISGHAGVFFDAPPYGTRKLCSYEILPILRLSGKANLGSGSGHSVGEAIERACVMSPFLTRGTAENKGPVICAMAISRPISKEVIQAALRVLRTFVDPEARLICTSIQDTTLDPGVYQATVIITGLEDVTPLPPTIEEAAMKDSVPYMNLDERKGGIIGLSYGDSLAKEDSLEASLNVFKDVARNDELLQKRKSNRSPRSFVKGGSYQKQLVEGNRSLANNSPPSRITDSKCYSWKSGPDSAAAKAWAKSRAEARKDLNPYFCTCLQVGVRQSWVQDEVAHSYREVQAHRPVNLQPLPHDPAAVPRSSVFSMSLGAMLDVCNAASALVKGKDCEKQPSLSQRAACMLENERSQKGLSPSVEMDFKGGTFKGRCEGGLPDGKGRLTYADGSFYDGHWVHGRKDGMGAFYFANGDMYQGFWRDDLMHGKGWLYLHTGDRLHAEFVKGKAHGEGRFYSGDGVLLFGKFRDNRWHGKCSYSDSSGSRWCEIWNSGVLVSREQL